MRINKSLKIRFIPTLTVCFFSLMHPSVTAEEITADSRVSEEKQAIAEAKERARLEDEREQRRRQDEEDLSNPICDRRANEEDKLDFADSIDTDGDGISNRYDVCRDVPDPDQIDTDNDNVGDACDSCPTKASPRYKNGCPQGEEPKL